MTSIKQIKANRKNALKGGVKTEKGKKTISRNAIAHGLTSQRIVSQNEQSLYKSILDELIEETAPEGYLEMIMCERIALHQMKLLRLIGIESLFVETNIVQSEIDYLQYKQPQQILHMIELGSYKNSGDEALKKEYQKQISGLQDSVEDLKRKYITLGSLNTLENLQRYDTSIENRLIRVIKEYQNLKEIKKKDDTST